MEALRQKQLELYDLSAFQEATQEFSEVFMLLNEQVRLASDNMKCNWALYI
jgi:hypothetical protein